MLARSHGLATVPGPVGARWWAVFDIGKGVHLVRQMFYLQIACAL